MIKLLSPAGRGLLNGFGVVICAGLIALLTRASFSQTTSSSMPGHAPLSADEVSTEVLWFEQPWGEMGVARLDNAPFPDDSRRDGYKTSKEKFS